MKSMLLKRIIAQIETDFHSDPTFGFYLNNNTQDGLKKITNADEKDRGGETVAFLLSQAYKAYKKNQGDRNG